ncbi:TPA: hypothetical protein ACH3X1_014275 [Trebouxia sp. C0004]
MTCSALILRRQRATLSRHCYAGEHSYEQWMGRMKRCRQMLRQEEVAKGIYQQHQPRKCQIANGFFVTGFLVTGLATGKRGQSETSLCVLWPKLVHCIL